MSRAGPILRLDITGPGLGPSRLALLEAIEAHGSISAAARAVQASYRRVWLMVDALNRAFDPPVVEVSPGGRTGGAARLTAQGRRVRDALRAVEAAAWAGAENDIHELVAALRVPGNPPGP